MAVVVDPRIKHQLRPLRTGTKRTDNRLMDSLQREGMTGMLTQQPMVNSNSGEGLVQAHGLLSLAQDKDRDTNSAGFALVLVGIHALLRKLHRLRKSCSHDTACISRASLVAWCIACTLDVTLVMLTSLKVDAHMRMVSRDSRSTLARHSSWMHTHSHGSQAQLA